VEPLGEQCPQCDFPFDARQPDPAPEELAAVIGSVVASLGKVRIRRTALPDRGCLYETTQGLFFVPQRLESVQIQTGEPARRSALAVMWKSPSLLWGGARARTCQMQVEVADHAPLEPRERDQLPTLLMQNPGVFFVARRSISHVRRGLWTWTLTRTNGLTLRIKVESDQAAFAERMLAIAGSGRKAVCS
jgi:hypothetical protein